MVGEIHQDRNPGGGTFVAWKMMSFKLCEEHSTRQTMTRDRAVTQATCHGAQRKGQLSRVTCGANVLPRLMSGSPKSGKGS